MLSILKTWNIIHPTVSSYRGHNLIGYLVNAGGHVIISPVTYGS